jgi:hypothetical protein
MNRSDVQDWLDLYIAAWGAHAPGPIRVLYSADVVFRWRQYESYPAAHGIDAVVDAWLGETRDEPDEWEAAYEPFAVDGQRAVATGWSRYFANDSEPEKTYQNVFLLTFADDGRCAEFTELYMLEQPSDAT